MPVTVRPKTAFLPAPARLIFFIILLSYISCGASFLWPKSISTGLSGLFMSSSSTKMSITMTSTSSSSSSLASDYAIRIHPANEKELLWDIYDVNQWADPGDALRELKCPPTHREGNNVNKMVVTCSMKCHWSLLSQPHCESINDNTSGTASWSIDVTQNVKDEVGVPMELFCILGRIMIQSAASIISKSALTNNNDDEKTLLHITLKNLGGSRICDQILLLLSNVCGDSTSGVEAAGSGVRQLFASLNSEYSKTELVDMVDDAGLVLGALPRPYIHTWNILHRGSGILVSREKDILSAVKEGGTTSFPDIYVHQRTSSKRIFPSLFDMFVGGVSGHGEDSQLTAAREVAEELGLTRALGIISDKSHLEGMIGKDKEIYNPLSEKLFQCTICTPYNRCVVSVFTYTASDAEKVIWQEEEVAWGDFIPYVMVEQAAILSMDRLIKLGIWPESRRHNIIDNTERFLNDKQLVINDEWTSKYSTNSWDFVPDGLLVWIAWKTFLSDFAYKQSLSSSSL